MEFVYIDSTCFIVVIFINTKHYNYFAGAICNKVTGFVDFGSDIIADDKYLVPSGTVVFMLVALRKNRSI